MAKITERRVKRVYNYHKGLIVMTFEDGNDAIVCDPPRLALWNFEDVNEAFNFARYGKMPTPPASISRGVGLSAAATDSKIRQQVVQQDNFVPIESTALILE